MSSYMYYSPQLTLFGDGCIEALGPELTRRGHKKALVVTDAVMVKVGITAKVTAVLEAAGIGFVIFDGVKPNPTTDNVEAGLAILKEQGCDFLVSIGGGSAHDCAKAIGLLATNGGSVEDYIGMDKTEHKSLDLVAINTTAGTGSECTRAYVITNERTHRKFGIRDKNSLAAIAVDDHSLMASQPPQLTAGTGMDALTHAVECIVSIRTFPLADELAYTAIRNVFKWLPKAVADGQDPAAREGMAVAQYLAGLAFGNGGVGLAHAMSHQLSAIYDLPHGLCNAILLPAVMQFNMPASEAKYAEMARVVDPVRCAAMSDAEAAKAAVEMVLALSETIGTKISLSSLGARREDIGLLADKALMDMTILNNPVQPDKEQVMKIYESLL